MNPTSILGKAAACALTLSALLLTSTSARAQSPSPEATEYNDALGADRPQRERRVRSGLVIAGSTLLGLGQASAFTVGALGWTFGSFESSGEPPDWTPMFIPLVGPFVAIESTHADALGGALLAVNGVAQLAGATMLLVGLVATEEVVPEAPRVGVAPMTNGSDAFGAVLTGTF